MAGNWKVTRTRENRYDEIGVTGHILRCTKEHGGVVDVLDVGCSTGIAMDKARSCLLKHDIKLYTVGFDISANVKQAAETNMDEFVCADILDVDNYDGKADVVVCASAARYVDGDHKGKIVKKCAKLLKKDGMLIVSVGRYKRFECETGVISARQSPVCIECCVGGLKWWLLRFEASGVMAMDNKRAECFADHVLVDWNGKWRVCRALWRICFRLIGSLNK